MKTISRTILDSDSYSHEDGAVDNESHAVKAITIVVAHSPAGWKV